MKLNEAKLMTAMVTPFEADGNLSLDKTEKLVEYLIENKTEALVVGGTTGESPTLTHAEKLELFAHTVKAVKGRIPVIAGTGTNSTASTVTLTKEAESLGVDGVMIVAPYYSKPNQTGFYEHFKTAAASTTLPVMVYNVPGRTAKNVEAATVAKLSEIDNIWSVKEASGDLDQMADVISFSKQPFSLYSGDDGLTVPAMSIGGNGVVSVASHVAGNEMHEMMTAVSNGDMDKASRIHRKLLPLMRGLFAAPSPVPVKTLLNELGIDVGPVRLPMVPLDAKEKNLLMDIYKKASSEK